MTPWGTSLPLPLALPLFIDALCLTSCEAWSWRRCVFLHLRMFVCLQGVQVCAGYVTHYSRKIKSPVRCLRGLLNFCTLKGIYQFVRSLAYPNLSKRWTYDMHHLGSYIRHENFRLLLCSNLRSFINFQAVWRHFCPFLHTFMLFYNHPFSYVLIDYHYLVVLLHNYISWAFSCA